MLETMLPAIRVAVLFRVLPVLCATVFSVAVAAVAGPIDSDEETMLMFVGEAEPIVTVASRYPESPTTAPAMVTVIDREQIRRSGWRTLAELLAEQPGFYLSAGGRGPVPYLRGLRDSILFLYNGVQITTDVTKSFAPLGQEVSLAGIERVEIVRGPGSVLWGADAFAGVVNLVPRRGKQSGTEAVLATGNERIFGADIGLGLSRINWDAFLGLSTSRERFHGSDSSANLADDVSFPDLSTSSYNELVGNLHVGDWLQVSGRWSGFEHDYIMQNETGSIVWQGIKESPFRFLKATVSKTSGASHYRLSGYVRETDYRVSDAGIERSQNNRTSYLEILWDRRLFSRGLLTLGGASRHNTVTGALVQDVFLPGFLIPNQDFFVPDIDQEDFSTQLRSVFSQFRYQWGAVSWWVGLRLDDHDQYSETLSHSVGFYRPLGRAYVKGVYGNAYRSPYSSQLFDNKEFEPEGIQTASLQLGWQERFGQFVELTLFQSHLRDHITESAFGLSEPADNTLYGFELAGKIALDEGIALTGGFSLVESSHRDEDYQVLLATFLRPDGSFQDIYDSWSEPQNQGPGWLARAGLQWQFAAGHNLELTGRVGGSYDYSYAKDTVNGRYRFPLLVDASYRFPGLFLRDSSFLFRVTNLFDREYLQPDIYGPVEGEPLKASLVFECRF